MKRIKYFKESLEDGGKIYILGINNRHGFRHDDYFYYTYSSEMLAADHLIKYINDVEGQKFEPFFEGDVRLFSSLDQNEDWEACELYCNENQIKYFIEECKYFEKPMRK